MRAAPGLSRAPPTSSANACGPGAAAGMVRLLYLGCMVNRLVGPRRWEERGHEGHDNKEDREDESKMFVKTTAALMIGVLLGAAACDVEVDDELALELEDAQDLEDAFRHAAMGPSEDDEAEREVEGPIVYLYSHVPCLGNGTPRCGDNGFSCDSPGDSPSECTIHSCAGGELLSCSGSRRDNGDCSSLGPLSECESS